MQLEKTKRQLIGEVRRIYFEQERSRVFVILTGVLARQELVVPSDNREMQISVGLTKPGDEIEIEVEGANYTSGWAEVVTRWVGGGGY